jgi:outer membrane protein OmpA-like peptidoglycan-associated protein
MRKLAAIGAFGLMASCLYAQGLNPGTQTKEDWEEINFEFNSSILSDGYPSLLRLADVLKEHTDYRVKVTGHTDYVGSNPYNEKLALQRAEAVKAFLVKYGANAAQITTAGDGERNPEVDNRTKEGRFMNRRVVLTVTDAQGKVIKEGGISEVLKALNAIQDRSRSSRIAAIRY